MRSGSSLIIRGIALALTLLLLCAGALASGVETDEDGGVWDWNSGTYTAPDGRVVPIVPDDGDDNTYNDFGASDDNGGSTSVVNDDGSVTIVNDADQIITNPDGSIVVESGQIQTVEAPQEEVDGDEKWAAGVRKAAIANGTYTPTFYVDGYGGMTEVPVEYMGICRSLIQLNGEYVLVDTSSLIWTTDAPLEKVLAVVKAKTYARLFDKPTKKKSTIIEKCYNGTVMRVLKTDKNWTMVDYKGVRGYVQTDSLTFYANEPREYRTGWVATKSGHTYGNSTVHVRNDPKGSQQEEYRVGTPITILEDDGTWCRIEVQGHVCYIQRQFMVYGEEQAAAQEAGT